MLTLFLYYQKWETERALLTQSPFIYLSSHLLDSLIHSHLSTWGKQALQ